MAVFVDLTGKRYGRLTVVKRVENSKNRSSRWLCKCDCGEDRIHSAGTLNYGTVKSCGCFGKEVSRELNTTHNKSNTKLYRVWATMRGRCRSQSYSGFRHYGGRGISVCTEWEDNFQSFYDWAISAGYREGLSIDRIDTNGNYEPQNCRWVSKTTQANNKRTNVKIEYNGEVHTVAEWASIFGLNYITLWMRLKRGWDFEKAISKEVVK